jgi:hypothetical protein
LKKEHFSEYYRPIKPTLMKKTLLFCFVIASTYAAVAQNTYLMLGTGLNSYHGIVGIGIEQRITDVVGVRAMAGIGSWGTKIGGGLIFRKHGLKVWGLP